MSAAIHSHHERPDHSAYAVAALDSTARFNDVTPDKFIEDICQRHAAKWIVSKVEGETVLDLGYGAGIVTGALLAAGKKVTVVEGSPVVYERIPCDRRLSLFEDFDTSESFDTVVASHVLEHVSDPVGLLKKLRRLSKRLIVLVPNAKSWHRRIAVQMGLIRDVYQLSERDKVEGHVRVYDREQLDCDLGLAAWEAVEWRGFFLKTLPNSMMVNHPPALIEALNEIQLKAGTAANMGVICE